MTLAKAYLPPPQDCRTSLALAPSNQAIVYALASSQQAGNYNTALLGVYRSASSGASGSWTTQVTNTDSNKLNTVQLSNPVYAFLADCGYGSSNQFINQGWYDNHIELIPKTRTSCGPRAST